MKKHSTEGLFPLATRAVRWGIIALVFSGYCGVAAAQPEDPQAPRRIAPQTFPEYRGRSTTDTQTRIALPTIEKPFGSCDENLPRTTWLRCLRQTIDAGDATIDELIEKARASVEGRADVGLGQRQFWSRTLGEAHAAWKAHRSHECQFLAVFENPGPESADERLFCQLRFNRLRIEDLKRRYGLD